MNMTLTLRLPRMVELLPDHVGSLRDQVHPMANLLFPNNDAILKMTIPPQTHTQPDMFSLGLRSTKMDFSISLASTFARLKYRRTTVVSFGEQGEKQILSYIISQATRCSS